MLMLANDWVADSESMMDLMIESLCVSDLIGRLSD